MLPNCNINDCPNLMTTLIHEGCTNWLQVLASALIRLWFMVLQAVAGALCPSAPLCSIAPHPKSGEGLLTTWEYPAVHALLKPNDHLRLINRLTGSVS
jgi:hypothetical protein